MMMNSMGFLFLIFGRDDISTQVDVVLLLHPNVDQAVVFAWSNDELCCSNMTRLTVFLGCN